MVKFEPILPLLNEHKALPEKVLFCTVLARAEVHLQVQACENTTDLVTLCPKQCLHLCDLPGMYHLASQAGFTAIGQFSSIWGS